MSNRPLPAIRWEESKVRRRGIECESWASHLLEFSQMGREILGVSSKVSDFKTHWI